MRLILLFLYTILFFISCSSMNEHSIKENSNELFGKKFKLVSIYRDMNITIEFTENSVFGSSALSYYSSSYIIDGDIFNVLSISAVKHNPASDKKAYDAEKYYFDMLKNATSYEISGKKLIIYTLLSDETLIFEEF